MKILIVSRQLYPYGMASVNRVHSYTQGFTKLGIETRVIIPEATIPFSEKDTTRNNKDEGFYNGVYFKYMSGTTIRHKNKLKRLIQDITSRIKTINYLLKESDNKTIIYVWGGGIIWCPMVILCGHYKKAMICTELNELPYGTGKENFRTRICRKIMLSLIFPKFDGFIAISESLKQLIELYNKKKNATLKVPILVDTNINNINVPLISHNHPFIFHSGTLSEQKDGIVKMLTAFALARNEVKDLEFYLTGDPEKSRDSKRIQETLVKYNIERYVHFLGYISNEQLRSYQKSCNLMIIYKYDTLQNKYCFSTKLGEYLAFEKPVIHTNIGEAQNYIKDKINAFVVDWKDTKGIADQIVQIIKNPSLAKEVGLKGKETCEKEFNYLIHAQRMINFFKQKINEND